MESKADTRIQEIKDLFYKDRLNAAFQKVFELEMDRNGAEVEFGAPGNQAIDEFLNGELVQTLRSDISMAEKFFQTFEDLSSWSLVKEKGSMKTWCKREKDVKAVFIASECLIECPFFNPLSIFAEIDLYNTWMPAVMNSIEVAKLSTFRRLLQVQLKFPIFFSNRDYVCSGVGNVDEKRKAVLFTLKGLQEGEYFGHKIPPPGKFVRMDLNMACLGLEYLEDNLCRFRCVVSVDPKLPIIPMTLINWGTKQVIFEFLKILTKKSLALQKEYQERIKKNVGGLYNEVQMRLSELIGKEIQIPFMDD